MHYFFFPLSIFPLQLSKCLQITLNDPPTTLFSLSILSSFPMKIHCIFINFCQLLYCLSPSPCPSYAPKPNLHISTLFVVPRNLSNHVSIKIPFKQILLTILPVAVTQTALFLVIQCYLIIFSMDLIKPSITTILPLAFSSVLHLHVELR